uniref:Glabrous enhancer-binding protein-like DBD domain-containing protein n=1 Tax=Leersia perrieri TaxID=77586 RepID=A0A0D9VLK1_9ORYZ
MAPKRSAPPPPPPVASSDETASGSDSDESEEEVEAPAALRAPVVSNKGEESESEEEEESEEEGEDDMVRSSATQKRDPPPQNREEDESSGDEEGESSDSDKAPPPPPPPPPPPNPAPKQVAAEGNGANISSPKKPAFQRVWSMEDDVRILEALAAHRREHGALPQIDALVSTLAGSLDHSVVDAKGLRGKISTLKRRYDAAAKRKSGELPTNSHDRRIFDICKIIWGSSDNAANVTTAGRAAGREFSEMCELYPHLGEEVKALEAAHPGLFKRDFGRLDDDKARALDMKVKKQRIAEITLELRRGDLTKEVTKVLAELVQ